MKISNKLTLSLLLIGLNAFSARVAVTDSGTDFTHDWLTGRALINTKEVIGNRVDDDRNGKVDDIYGWNFADNYGKVFFKDHVADVPEKVFKIMDVLSRIQAGNPTPEDQKFWKENITSLSAAEKQKLVTQLNFFGQYAHGTHVSGIVASVAPDARIMSNRVFPDTPMSFVNPLAANQPAQRKGLMDMAYRLLAVLTNGTFEGAAAYIGEQQIDVANYSMGVQLSAIAGMALSLRKVVPPTADEIAVEAGKRCPKGTDEAAYKSCVAQVTEEVMAPYNAKLSAEVQRMYAQYEPQGKKWLASAPKTLFVIAAGNDGSDNDKRPTFPANIQVDNSITVAASNSVISLASFSNYGITTVHVAAPGVAIKSSVPSLDNKMVLPMSGTSMAAPYVTGVAAKMKDLNPQLTPAQLKEILMGTVDKKDWLKAKVISGGVVNAERAYMASEKSKSMTVAAAIAASIEGVTDQKEVSAPKRIFKVNSTTQEMNAFANEVVF